MTPRGGGRPPGIDRRSWSPGRSGTPPVEPYPYSIRSATLPLSRCRCRRSSNVLVVEAAHHALRWVMVTGPRMVVFSVAAAWFWRCPPCPEVACFRSRSPFLTVLGRANEEVMPCLELRLRA